MTLAANDDVVVCAKKLGRRSTRDDTGRKGRGVPKPPLELHYPTHGMARELTVRDLVRGPFKTCPQCDAQDFGVYGLNVPEVS